MQKISAKNVFTQCNVHWWANFRDDQWSQIIKIKLLWKSKKKKKFCIRPKCTLNINTDVFLIKLFVSVELYLDCCYLLIKLIC